jgi:H+/Cl- antiporter ClcA
MERRNLVTIGASCGFAASFGAPIGGLLFVLDDISSFVEKSMFLRVLVSNAIATFCLALYRGDLSAYGAIQFGKYEESKTNIFVDRFEEIPFWILMGVGGGVLGGYFCKTFYMLKKWSATKFNTNALQILRTSYITWATCVVLFFLPMMKWTCHDILVSDEGVTVDDLVAGITTVSSTTGEVVKGRRYFCDQNHVNEMATIMFGSRNKAIVRILSNPNEFYPLTLGLVGIIFFVFMSFTNTISIPSGMFTPTVLSGASLGGAVGLILKDHVDENINPSTFALLGVAALMAGVQRSTVSTW